MKKVSWGKGFLRLVVLAAFIAALVPTVPPPVFALGWYDTDWQYRQKITIDHDRVGTMSALSENASAGATVIFVRDTSRFSLGNTVVIMDDNHKETNEVDGITPAQNKLEMWDPLSYNYTTAAHAFVKNDTSPGTALSNFPVLVQITDQTNPIFGQAQGDGDDILFTASDGTTKLSHEIDYYHDSGTKELDAWVKVPTLSTSADTTLYMYYGNGTCSSQEDTENVWEEISTISNCESTTDWSGTSVATDSGDKKQGTYSLKDTVDSPGSGTEYETTYDPSGTLDLDDERIDFWLKSDRASTAYTWARLYAYEDATTYCYWNLTFDAGAWTHVVKKSTLYDGKSTGPAPDLSSIDHISLNFKAADTTGFYKKIDWIRAKSGAVMVQHLQETSPTGTYAVGVTYDDHLDSTSNDNDGEVFADNTVTVESFNSGTLGQPVQLGNTNINAYPEVVVFDLASTYYDEGTDWTMSYSAGEITALASAGMSKNKDYWVCYTYPFTNLGATMSATGQIAGADYFDETDDFIDCGKDDSIGNIKDAITVEVWVNLASPRRPNAGVYEEDDPDYAPASSNAWEMCIWSYNGSGGGGYDFYNDGWFSIGAGGPVDCYAETTPIYLDKWTYVVITFDGTTIYSYVNCDFDASLGAIGLMNAVPGTSTFIGLSTDLFEQVKGTIDEVRISDVARGAEWFSTSYSNQVSPGAFCSRATWESYKTNARTEVWGTSSDHYDSSSQTAHMKGVRFAVSHDYKIGYYDGSGDIASSESPTSDAGGVLEGECDLTADSGAAAGTWHSVVFDTSGAIPDTYDAAKLDPSYVGGDEFEVDASAIPEFPTVMAGIGVAGLCFGIYYWMRKRKQRQVAAA